MKRTDERTDMLTGYVAGREIRPAIMNASGISPYPSELEPLSDYFGALVTKSTGIEPREGNETPIIAYSGNKTWVNAVGLPNPGYGEMAKELMKVHPSPVPWICSIFGHSEKEIILLGKCVSPHTDMIELNVSCPNIKKGEKTGIMIGMDPKLVYDYTKTLTESVNNPVIVKLSPGPYIDDGNERKNIRKIARAAVDAGAKGLSMANTTSGGMVINVYSGKPVLSAKFGGVSGPGLKPTGVGMTYVIRQELGEDISIIGMGGIGTAEDVLEYVEAGADAVAIGTEFLNLGEGVTKEDFLDELTDDLYDLVTDKLGKKSLVELWGKAHG